MKDSIYRKFSIHVTDYIRQEMPFGYFAAAMDELWKKLPRGGVDWEDFELFMVDLMREPGLNAEQKLSFTRSAIDAYTRRGHFPIGDATVSADRLHALRVMYADGSESLLMLDNKPAYFKSLVEAELRVDGILREGGVDRVELVAVDPIDYWDYINERGQPDKKPLSTTNSVEDDIEQARRERKGGAQF